MRRSRRTFALVTVVALALTVVAWAIWSTSGSGTGSATVGNLTAATITVPPTSTGSHAVTWTQQATTGNATLDNEITYSVERKTGPLGTFAPVATGPCAGGLPHGTASCMDTVGEAGSYTYRVVASFRSWTATSAEAGPVVAIVNANPKVTSIARVGSSPTKATSVSWTVTFSEDVSGVDPTDFDLVPTGVTGASITSVTPASGPEDVYTVTANTGSGNGTLGLDLDDDDSIKDGTLAPLVGPSDANGDFTGEVYAIDKTAPTVQSINRIGSELTNGGNVQWSVTFSENVNGVNDADFSVVQAGGVTGAVVTTVSPGSGPADTYTVTASTGSGSGTLGLNLTDDDSVQDPATNPLGTPGNGNGNFTGQVFTLDKTGPTVQSMNRVNADPTNAASVSWTVVLSESSSGVGAEDFQLAPTGVTGASITGFTSVNGTTYTVTASTGSDSGTLGLNLVDDDSITDQLGNALGGSGIVGPGNGSFTGQVYTIDRTGPTVQSINRVGSSPTNAGSVQWTVTFSESASGVTAADFDLVPSGLGGTPAITAVTPAGPATTYTVTASTGSGSGTLGLNLDDDDTIADALGNKLGGTGVDNGDFTGAVYTLDRAAPTVSSINRAGANPTGSTSVSWTVTFSEAVSGVDATDFTRPQGGSVSGSSTTSVTPVGAAPATTWTVVVNTGTGNGTLGLSLTDNDSIVDVANNALNGNFTGQVYTIEKTAPTVSSINRVGSASTNASSVQWTVTFSESVSGVTDTDFTLPTTGGVSAPSITSVTGSGSSYTVTANTGSGDGTLGLNLVDDDSIVDTAGNALNGGFTGQTFTIDKTAPTVVSIARTGSAGNPTDATSVQWLVTYSESVSGVATADYQLATTGVTGASLTTVTGTSPGTTRTVTASTGSGSGTVGLAALDDDTVVDGAGNNLAAGLAEDAAWRYTIDKPSVVSINRSSAENPTNDASVTFTVTFSEPVSGVTSGDFTRVTSGLSSTSTGTPTAVGGSPATTWTVVVNTGSGSGTLGLNLTDDDTIVDANGRRLGGAGSGNGNFTGEVFTIDRAAPALETLEMFDDDANGLIDRVDATFDEPLDPSGANVTSGWTVTDAPGGVALSAVSVSGSTASLSFTGGTAGAASTMVDQGSNDFEIDLSSGASGQIRDSFGAKASFSNQTPDDKAGPVPFDYVDDDTTGVNDGRLQTGDTLTVSFTELLGTYSTAAAATLRGGTGGANDDLSLPGTLGNAFTTLTRTDYITGDGTLAVFSGATAVRHSTQSQMRISLGANCTTSTICSTNVTTPGGTGNYTYTPPATIVDLASPANPAVGSHTENTRLF